MHLVKMVIKIEVRGLARAMELPLNGNVFKFVSRKGSSFLLSRYVDSTGGYDIFETIQPTRQ